MSYIIETIEEERITLIATLESGNTLTDEFRAKCEEELKECEDWLELNKPTKSKTLIIPEYQAKETELTLRLISDYMSASDRDSCMKRRLVQAHKWMKNVLSGKSDTLVLR